MRRQMLITASTALVTLATLGSLANNADAGTLYISDDFSTFANGNLVGQNGWTQDHAPTTLPLQVSSGNVVIPGSQNADNQDAVKSFGTLILPNSSVFLGMSLTVNSATPVGKGASYFTAMNIANDGTGFDNDRLTAIDNTTNPGGSYFLEARVTGQAGSPFTAGTLPLLYGTTYNVVVEGDLTGSAADTVKVFVNQSLYLTSSIGTGSPLASLGSMVISQFANAAGTTVNSGIAIDHVRVADNFNQAAGVPEPSSIMLACLGIATIGLIRLRRRK